MDFVAPALIAEGPTDDRFLQGILGRLLAEVVFSSATRNFEIADIVPIGDRAGLPSPATVIEWLERQGAHFTIVFVHRDADARDLGAKAEGWIAEIKQGLTAESPCLVFTIPIRMIEAWALVDGDALRTVLGVAWDDQELGLPSSPAQVEAIQDPKAVVRQISGKVSGPRIDLYARLGDRIGLDHLRQLPAFRTVEQQLVECLSSQGVIQ